MLMYKDEDLYDKDEDLYDDDYVEEYRKEYEMEEGYKFMYTNSIKY